MKKLSLKESIIKLQDCVAGLKLLPNESADIVLIDPPYNIGKDFGNDSDNQDLDVYIKWCIEWLRESERILKPTGTMYIYGFPEILAHISVHVKIPHKWIAWHYTNKNTPHYKFWQRSHESIIVAWKSDKQRIFNLDEVREPYTDTFLKNAAGKVRKGTPGRFSKEGKETIYQAHDKGALPRDVLKVPALAGGAGASERWFYCPKCQESFPNNVKAIHEKHSTLVVHPTQKPLGLTKRLLLAAKPEKDGLVVIPFIGTGSEAFVARELGLNYIGFELNPDYVKLAESFLKKTAPKIKKK